MEMQNATERRMLASAFLKRLVTIDFYIPPLAAVANDVGLLFVNDGQDLVTMDFAGLLQQMYDAGEIHPLCCVAIHAGPDRKNEYGTAGALNDQGLGAKAGLYNRFIMEELLPYVRKKYPATSFCGQSFCGFSLGALSAFDIVWNHADVFSKVGAFSGSFWWRSVAQDQPQFDEKEHRILQCEVRRGTFHPGLQFFFETGTLDETADRNNNGIIDSIDDTLALIDELVAKGYSLDRDIRYLELPGGRHDVPTWRSAFPEFLKWGWAKQPGSRP